MLCSEELHVLERSFFRPTEFCLRGENVPSDVFDGNNLCGMPHPPVLKLLLSLNESGHVFRVGESGAIENLKDDLDDKRDTGVFESGVNEPRGDVDLGGDIRRSVLVRFACGVCESRSA